MDHLQKRLLEIPLQGLWPSLKAKVMHLAVEAIEELVPTSRGRFNPL